MPEVLQQEVQHDPPAGRESDVADPRPCADPGEAGRLEDIARLAPVAGSQQRTRDQLRDQGFCRPEPYFTEREGRVARVDKFEAGDIRYQTTLDVPRSMIESFSTGAAPDVEALIKEYEAARLDPDTGPIRFLCGRVWYTLKSPFTLQTFAKARRELGLPEYYTREQFERWLNFRFQQIHQKPDDRRTADERTEWRSLLSYIDVEAYKNDNPPTDNRIGKLIHVDSEKVIIRWQTAGEVTYDSRVVPPEVITAPKGWLVYAEIQFSQGSEIWLSERVEPPIGTDEEIISDHLARISKSAAVSPPVAHWPKIGE